MVKTQPARLYDVPHIYEGNSLMDTSDSREGTSTRQARTILPPAVQPAGIYTRQQIENNLGMSKKTFAQWLANGLKPIPNTGTDHSLFFAEDVFAYLQNLKKGGQ